MGSNQIPRRVATWLAIKHLSEVLSHLGLTKWHLSEVLSHLGLTKFNLFEVVSIISRKKYIYDLLFHIFQDSAAASEAD